jgi:uncharacterized protein
VNWLAWLLALPIRFYRRFVSPWTPASCRFRPTCSAYAQEALELHGPFIGLWLALRRVLRCHPFTPPGYDPVPPPRGTPPPEAPHAAPEGAQRCQHPDPPASTAEPTSEPPHRR